MTRALIGVIVLMGVVALAAMAAVIIVSGLGITWLERIETIEKKWRLSLIEGALNRHSTSVGIQLWSAWFEHCGRVSEGTVHLTPLHQAAEKTVVLTNKIDDERAKTAMAATSAQQQTASEPTCESVQDVAIVGAGIAGSYAAWRMRNAGMSVSLHEYSNRIGGRCYTVKFPGIPDVNVELGSMRYKPLDHPKLNKTINDLGLEIIDFELGKGANVDTLYYLRGQHFRYDEIAPNAPYNLPPDQRKDLGTLKWEIFKNFTDVDLSVDGYSGIPEKLFHNSLDGVPLYMQSRESFYAKYLDMETARYIQDTDGYDSDHGDVAAANYIARSDPNTPSGPSSPVKTVSTGFQSIPVTMVDQFLKASQEHRIYRNHHLRAITRNKDGNYVLSFQPTRTVRGVTTDDLNAGRKTTCAKKVLLAIPRMALEHLDWAGLKHPEIVDYIKNSLRDAKAGKMYFAHGDTWWRDLPLASPYAVSTTPLRQTYDYAASPSNGKGVLNVGYPELFTKIWRDSRGQGNFVPGVGDDSVAMTNVGVNLARKMYAEIFNVSVDDVQQPDYAVMSIWDQYPIGASWYQWRSGYIWEEGEVRMTRPSPGDDVFIISNTFSRTKKTGWVEGALEIVDNALARYFPGV